MRVARSFLAGAGLFIWAAAALSPAAAQTPPRPFDAPAETDPLASSDLLQDPDALDSPESAGSIEATATAYVEQAGYPLALNVATAEDLARVPGLDPLLAQAVVADRTTNGPFKDVADLIRVPGCTPGLLETAAPFLTVDGGDRPPDPGRPARPRWKARFTQRITHPLRPTGGPAARDTAYAGSNWRVYTRMQIDRGPWSARATLEKDPGEAFEWNPARRLFGYDHVVGNVAFTGTGVLRTLITGDYEADWGEGLVLGSTHPALLSAATASGPVKPGIGFRPYGSSVEYGYFRGVALRIAPVASWTLACFVSRRRVDARFTEADTPLYAPGGAGEVDALIRTGLHRTDLERARRGTLATSVAGLVTTYDTGRISMGLTGVHTRYDAPIAAATEPHRRFGFSGRRGTVAGAFVRGTLGDAYLFGEVARGVQGRIGGIAGALIRPMDGFAFTAFARHYPAGFTSPHGGAFGQPTTASYGASGAYLGVRAALTPRLDLTAYVDQYRSHWLPYATARPAEGFETLGALTLNGRTTVSLQGRLTVRDVSTDRDAPDGSTWRTVAPRRRYTVRLQIRAAPDRSWRFQSRVEIARARTPEGEPHTGILLYQDVRFRPTRAARIDVRLTYFDAAHHAVRLYAHENDLTHTFSLSGYGGRGYRAYVLFSVSLGARIEWQVKGAITDEGVPTSVFAGDPNERPRAAYEGRTQLRLSF